MTKAGGHPVTRPHQVTGQGDVYWEDLAAGVDIVGPGVTMTEAHLVSWV